MIGEQGISRRQFVAMAFVAALSPLIRRFPRVLAEDAGRTAWLAVILTALPLALSLLLAAMGRHLSGAQESIFSLAAADAAALAPPVGTHGSQVRRRYGRPGAREEAMDGFPSLQALLQATRSQPPLGVLLWSMAHLSDSNLLYRGGEAGLAFAQNEAERILRLPQAQWEGELTALDAEMTRRNLSPGGSADLLALTLFFRSLDFWAELSV